MRTNHSLTFAATLLSPEQEIQLQEGHQVYLFENLTSLEF